MEWYSLSCVEQENGDTHARTHINYLWVHPLQSNGTSFHIMHVRQGVRHIWNPTRFNVWETLFRILVTFAFDNAAQPLASLDVTKWRCFKNKSKQIRVHINLNDVINEQNCCANFLKKGKIKTFIAGRGHVRFRWKRHLNYKCNEAHLP